MFDRHHTLRFDALVRSPRFCDEIRLWLETGVLLVYDERPEHLELFDGISEEQWVIIFRHVWQRAGSEMVGVSDEGESDETSEQENFGQPGYAPNQYRLKSAFQSLLNSPPGWASDPELGASAIHLAAEALEVTGSISLSKAIRSCPDYVAGWKGG